MYKSSYLSQPPLPSYPNAYPNAEPEEETPTPVHIDEKDPEELRKKQEEEKPESEGEDVPGFEVVIKSVPFQATEEDVREFFKDCGEIVQVKLIKGKAWVKFATYESQEKAYMLDQFDMLGRNVSVSISYE